MSLSGEGKEKDKKKKSPLSVLMCSLAVGQLFAAKALHRLKCSYSIKHPLKPPASYLAAICLRGLGIQLFPRASPCLTAGEEPWHACNKRRQVYNW